MAKQAQAEVTSLQAKVAECEALVAGVSGEKRQLEAKLAHAETTIDDLNQQLLNLGKSDTLTRQRDRQDTMLKCMQQKHQTEVFHLQEKLDAVQKDLTEKVRHRVAVQKQTLDKNFTLRPSNVV